MLLQSVKFGMMIKYHCARKTVWRQTLKQNHIWSKRLVARNPFTSRKLLVCFVLTPNTVTPAVFIFLFIKRN
jgi:hypothetical protein